MKWKTSLVLGLLLLAIPKGWAVDDEDMRSSEFNYSKRKDSYFYTSEGSTSLSWGEFAAEAQEKQKIIWENKVSESRQEKIISPVGHDGRTRLRETVRNKEHMFNCYLEIYYANVDGQARIYYGSGILIAPNLILTAGHNLYDVKDGGYPDRIDCFVACFRATVLAEATVFPKEVPQSVYVHSEYVSIENQKAEKLRSQKEDECYQFSKSDIALIVFDQPVFKNINYPMAYETLQDDLETFIKDKIKFTLTGYPGRRKAYTMKGILISKDKDVVDRKLCYNIDTEKGQSGSGICFTAQDGTYCIGVHTCAGEGCKEPYNIGVLIDKEIGDKIDEFSKYDD